MVSPLYGCTVCARVRYRLSVSRWVRARSPLVCVRVLFLLQCVHVCVCVCVYFSVCYSRTSTRFIATSWLCGTRASIRPVTSA
jgi:hypothetical protein